MVGNNARKGCAFRIAVGLALVLLMAGGAGAETGLVGYWRFDGDAQDSGGNGNHGTNYGAAFVQGISGEALGFDGSDDYVNVLNSASLDITGNQLTMEAWIKVSSFPSSNYHADIAGKGGAECGGGYELQVQNAHWTRNSAVAEFLVYAGGSYTIVDTDPLGTLNTGTWYHVAGVYDGSTQSIYLNGVLAKSYSRTGNINSVSRPLEIGRRPSCNNLAAQFNGIIDEVRIYNRALSAEEIRAHYEQGEMPKISAVQLNRIPSLTSQTGFRLAQPISRSPGIATLSNLSVYANTLINNPTTEKFEGYLKIILISSEGKKYSQVDQSISLNPESSNEFSLPVYDPSLFSMSKPGTWEVKVQLEKKIGIFKWDRKLIDEKTLTIEVKNNEVVPTVEGPKNLGINRYISNTLTTGEKNFDFAFVTLNTIYMILQAPAGKEPHPLIGAKYNYIIAESQMADAFSQTAYLNLKDKEEREDFATGAVKTIEITWSNIPQTRNIGTTKQLTAEIPYDRAVITITVPWSLFIENSEIEPDITLLDNGQQHLVWVINKVDKLILPNDRDSFSIEIRDPWYPYESYEIAGSLFLEVGPLQGELGSEYTGIANAPFIYNYNKWKENPDDVYWYIVGVDRKSIGIDYPPYYFRNYGTAYETSASIHPYETHNHVIPIDITDTKAIFITQWQGSNLNLTLLTPNGTLINPSSAGSDPNITYIENATYKYYLIQKPVSGNWTMNITAINVSEAGENYTAGVSLTTNLTLSLLTDKYRYDPNELINIEAILTNNSMPVAGALVQAEIQRPDGLDTLILFDDGTHGDAQADDGVYSNNYSNTSIEGTYNIKVTATGTIDGYPFARDCQTSVLVQLAPDLVVSEITFSNDTPFSGDGISINVTISNVGNANASNFTVSFYDGDPINGTLLIGTDTITSNLTAGETTTTLILWSARSGTHDIYAQVDFYHSVLEKNESNNIANKTLYVTPIYKLSIIASGTDKLMYAPNENVTIYGIVENADHDLFSPDVVYAQIKNYTFNLSEYSTGFYVGIFNQTSQTGTYNITIYANKTAYINDSVELSFDIAPPNLTVNILLLGTAMVNESTSEILKVKYTNFTSGDPYNISITAPNGTRVYYDSGNLTASPEIIPINWTPSIIGNHTIEAWGRGMIDSTPVYVYDSEVVSPIPELSTMVLTGIGMLGLVFMARRKR